MHRLLVAFTTYDGHTAKIAQRIASTLRENDCAVEVCDLARWRPERSVHEYDGVIAGGPLHGGKHHRQLVRFAAQNRNVLNEQPSAFFSVSLSAAGNVEQQGDATRCLKEFLNDTGWKPSATAIVAGALLYREYGFFKRWMMKMIVKRGGTGDTDTSRNYVYTDWDAVDDFAKRFTVEHARRVLGRPTSTIV
jgi:menaquinone-dependent protoporphyrinogen oxidase